MNSLNTNTNRTATSVNDPALNMTTHQPLSSIKIRLSSLQAKHLWDKGYRFEDLSAILKVADTEFPVNLMYPSNVMKKLPTQRISKPKKFNEGLKLLKVDGGFKLQWEKFEFERRRCPCYAETNSILEPHIALCDHKWHDLCLISKHIEIKQIFVAFSRTDCQWLAHVFAHGKNFMSRRPARADAVNDAVTCAYDEVYKNRQTVHVEPNMDNSDNGLASQDGTGPDQLEAVRDGNVALTTARGESEATTAVIPTTDTKTEYYSEAPAIFEHLTDRDLALPPVAWTTDQAAGTVIASYDLPYDILANNLNSPNFVPFTTYAQVEPNLTIRAQLQSVPTNGGTLVVGVRYAALDEVANDPAWALAHTAQLVQTNHVLLSAQSSNSSELKIPFQYFLDRVPTTFNAQAHMLYYCTMYVAVLNPLVVAPETQNFVNVNFYCSFQCDGAPTRFFGQRNYFDAYADGPLRSISHLKRSLRSVQPNGAMMSTMGDVAQAAAPVVDIIEPGLGTALGGVGGAVSNIGNAIPRSTSQSTKTNSRPLMSTDHPQAVLVQSHGLAISTAPLDSKSMRLQKPYATPHPPGRLDSTDNLSNKFITSVHGLIAENIEINVDQSPGTVIYQWDVTPAEGLTVPGLLPPLTRFYPTPIGAMSYCYCNYSGDLIITAVIGSALLHSVRLRFQYIPDYSAELVEGLDPLNERNDFFSTVYDIQEQTQFSFKIPYQSLTPMNPIWRSANFPVLGTEPSRLSYGTFRIILETPLKANAAVSPNVYMSLFLSGAENFQLAIPRACNFPPVDNTFIRKIQKVTPNVEERVNDPSTISPQPSGTSGIPRHVGERHDISDLIRRYVVVAEDFITVPVSDTAQYVVADWPVNASVPNVRVGGIRKFGENSRQIDPLTHLQDAFRFNKGSIRYVITVSSPSPLQFDVFHLPYVASSEPNPVESPLALRTFARTAFNGYLDNQMGSGVASEYFDTTYNSSLSVEVPYYQPTSCLLSDAISTATYDETWSSFGNGRMRMVSRPFTSANPTPVTITIYRAAGNDFQMSAFQGFPPRYSITPTIPVQSAARVPTTRDETQDFNFSYAKLERFSKRTHKLALRKVKPNMMATLRSAIELPFSAVRNTLEIPLSINSTIQEARRVTTAAADLLNGAEDNIHQLGGCATDSISQLTSLITRIFQPFAHNFNTTSFIAHLLVLRDSKNTTFSRISAFFGILGLVGIFTVKVLADITQSVYKYVSRVYAQPLETNNVDSRRRRVTPNMDDLPSNDNSELVEICSLFSTGLSTVFGIFDSTGLARKFASISTSLAKQRSVERFFELAIKWVHIAIAWARGEKDPETIHAENLQKHSKEIKEWATEVDLLTSLHNQDRIFSSPTLQRRVDAAKQKGVSYFGQLDEFPRGVTQAITFYYRRICELYDQVGMRLGGGEIPQEPISLWIYGKPGCGKSYLLDTLLIEVMRMLKIVFTGDPIYTRDGNKYWNGLCGQPAIKYDDVGVNRSPAWMETFVQEYFSLHSCATFNPEQADIRDKNRVVNARVVGVASNKTFHKDYVGQVEAFKRRRDFVIAARQNPHWFAKHAPGAKNCNDPRLTGPMLQNFDHMCFRLQDKMDEHDYTDAKDGWMTFGELLRILKPQVLAINERRAFASRNRRDMTNALSPDYWATVGQQTTAPELTTMTTDINALERVPVTPNMFAAHQLGNVIQNVADFFSSRPEARYHSYSYFSEWAGAEGTYEDVNAVHYNTEFASGIDFTRIGCLHHDLTLEFEFNRLTQCYEFGSVSIPLEECGDRCALSQVGLARLKTTWDAGKAILAGERFSNLHTMLDLPTHDRHGNPIGSNQHIINPRHHRYNMHNIIDTIIRRFRMFTFNTQTWLGRNIDLVLTCLHVVFVVAVYIGFLAFAGYLDNKIAEQEKAKFKKEMMEEFMFMYGIDPDERRPRDDMEERLNTRPNLLQSGDVKTRTASKQVRKTAVKRVSPNAPCGLTSLLNKNFIEISYFKRSDPRVYKIGAFMLGDRTAICPAHLWEGLNLDDEYEWTEVPVSPQEYSNLAQRQVKHIFVDEPIRGPVKFICNGKNPLYTDYATTRQSTNEEKPEIFNLLDTDLPKKSKAYVLALCDYAQSDEGRIIKVKFGNTAVKVRYDNIEFHDINTEEDLDLSCFTFKDNAVPQFRNTLQNFAKDGEFDRVNLNEVELVLANENRSIYLNKCRETDFICDYGSTPSKTLIGLEYDNPTGYYPCSSILVDTRHSKILGFHTCSSPTLGFALYIPLEILPKLSFSLPEMPETTNQPSKFNLTGEFIAVGTSPNAISQPFKSALKHSLIHSEFESYRFPAAMRSREDTFIGEVPLKKGCEKQTVTPPLPETPEETRLINEYLHNLILNVATPTHTVKPHLNVLEAIQGVPGIPFMDPLKLSTSAGWPYNVGARSLKKHYIQRDDDGEITNIDETFMRNYNEYHKARLEGRRPCTVFTDFLKDERIKPGKDTRLINGSPLEYTIEMRRYFLDFISALKARRFAAGFGIGMNVHSPDVTELVNLLRKKGDKYICGDYSSFGPTLDPNAVMQLGILANEWYDRYCPTNTPEDNRIRLDLLSDSNNALHLAYDFFYITLGGSPSGSPATDVINSYVNKRYICRAWLHIMKSYPHLVPLSTFRAKVAEVVYGDDLIMSTTGDIAEIFNNSTISDYFATIGIKYTDATKTGAEPYCSLDKATFLKCNFVKHPTRRGQWLAALDWKCVNEIPAWIRKSSSDEDATIENCNAALLNAHGHGPEKYNFLRGKVTEALQKLNIPYSSPTWEQTDNNFFDSNQFGYTPFA